jgi:hypothetical protein
MILIKTLESEYVVDENFSINSYEGNLKLNSKTTYQILTQMNSNGQVGYGFLRMDNGITPMEEEINLNTAQIIFSGKINKQSNFAKMFEEAKTREAAKASGLVLP